MAGKKKKGKSQTQKANGKGFANDTIPAPLPHSRVDYSKFENIDYDSDDDEDMEGSPRPLVTGCDCDICAVKGAQCSSGCERGHSDVDRAEIESTKIRNIFVEAAAAAMYEANKDKIVKGGILRGFLSGAKISSDTDVPSMNVAADNKGLGSSGFRINRPAAINADDATDSDDDDSSLPSLVTDDGDIEPSNFVPQTPSDSDEEVGIPYFPGTSSAKQYAAHDKASSQNLRPAISAASKPAVPSKQETMPGAKESRGIGPTEDKLKAFATDMGFDLNNLPKGGKERLLEMIDGWVEQAKATTASSTNVRQAKQDQPEAPSSATAGSNGKNCRQKPHSLTGMTNDDMKNLFVAHTGTDLQSYPGLQGHEDPVERFNYSVQHQALTEAQAKNLRTGFRALPVLQGETKDFGGKAASLAASLNSRKVRDGLAIDHPDKAVSYDEVDYNERYRRQHLETLSAEEWMKQAQKKAEENSRQLLAEEARQKEEQRRKQEEREEAKRNKRKHKQQKKKEKNKQKDEATEASKAEPSKGDANEAEGSKAGLTSAGKITNGQDAEHPASPQPTKEQIPAAKSATIPPPEVQPIASKQPADKATSKKAKRKAKQQATSQSQEAQPSEPVEIAKLSTAVDPKMPRRQAEDAFDATAEASKTDRRSSDSASDEPPEGSNSGAGTAALDHDSSKSSSSDEALLSKAAEEDINIDEASSNPFSILLNAENASPRKSLNGTVKAEQLSTVDSKAKPAALPLAKELEPPPRWQKQPFPSPSGFAPPSIVAQAEATWHTMDGALHLQQTDMLSSAIRQVELWLAAQSNSKVFAVINAQLKIQAEQARHILKQKGPAPESSNILRPAPQRSGPSQPGIPKGLPSHNRPVPIFPQPNRGYPLGGRGPAYRPMAPGRGRGMPPPAFLGTGQFEQQWQSTSVADMDPFGGVPSRRPSMGTASPAGVAPHPSSNPSKYTAPEPRNGSLNPTHMQTRGPGWFGPPAPGRSHRPVPPKATVRPPAQAKSAGSAHPKVPEFGMPMAEASRSDQLEEEELTCCICLEWPPEIVLQPCGHNNMCEKCAYEVKNLNEGLCPECRCKIEAIIRPR